MTGPELSALCDAAMDNEWDKEKGRVFAEQSQKFTQRVFRDQKTLLEQIKLAKKAFLAKNRQ